MSFLTLLLVAVGVSADAFAVAVGKGLGMRRWDPRAALSIALAFGLFQGVMPVIGWFLGSQFASYITAFDHWIAFALLALVGGRMLWQSLSAGDEKDPGPDRTSWREVLALALATSIDALAVGISFAFLTVDIVGAALLIAGTTLVISLGGVVVGHRAGARFRGPAEVAGGLVLIGMGIRVPMQHLGYL